MAWFGFWHFIGLLIILSTLGGGAKILLKYRLAMRKAELKQLRRENKTMRRLLKGVQVGDDETIKLLTERVETLETIATDADDDLNRKFRELKL